jgi:N-acetylmuramic acid 6-phosphate etherase
MLRLGRIHAGLMVDMRASNAKLRARATAIVAEIAGVDLDAAGAALAAASGSIKHAVLVARDIDPTALDEAGGNLREALRRR